MVVERGCWTAPEALSGADTASFAKRVEELGYAQLWVGETFGRDPFALAAHLGAVTSTLGLATGIANVYNRHAGVMKQGRVHRCRADGRPVHAGPRRLEPGDREQDPGHPL